jgi:hypothetical protein
LDAVGRESGSLLSGAEEWQAADNERGNAIAHTYLGHLLISGRALEHALNRIVDDFLPTNGRACRVGLVGCCAADQPFVRMAYSRKVVAIDCRLSGNP